MGFDENDAKKALKLTKNNMDDALNMILNGFDGAPDDEWSD